MTYRINIWETQNDKFIISLFIEHDYKYEYVSVFNTTHSIGSWLERNNICHRENFIESMKKLGSTNNLVFSNLEKCEEAKNYLESLLIIVNLN